MAFEFAGGKQVLSVNHACDLVRKKMHVLHVFAFGERLDKAHDLMFVFFYTRNAVFLSETLNFRNLSQTTNYQTLVQVKELLCER